MNPKIPIENIAYAIPSVPNTGLLEFADIVVLIIPKAGMIRI